MSAYSYLYPDEGDELDAEVTESSFTSGGYSVYTTYTSADGLFTSSGATVVSRERENPDEATGAGGGPSARNSREPAAASSKNMASFCLLGALASFIIVAGFWWGTRNRIPRRRARRRTFSDLKPLLMAQDQI